MKVTKEGRKLKFEREGEVGYYDLGRKELEVPKGYFKGLSILDLLVGVEEEVYGRYMLSIDMLLNGVKSLIEGGNIELGARSYKEELKEWLKMGGGRRKNEVSIKKYFEVLGDNEVLERYFKLGYNLNLSIYDKEKLEREGALKSKLVKELLRGIEIIEGEDSSKLNQERSSVRGEKEVLKRVKVELQMGVHRLLRELGGKGELKLYQYLKEIREKGDNEGIYILIKEGLCGNEREFINLLKMLNYDIVKVLEGFRYYVDVEDLERCEVYNLWHDTLNIERLIGVESKSIPRYLESRHNRLVVKLKSKDVLYSEELYGVIYERESEKYKYVCEEYEVKMFESVDEIKREGEKLNHCVYSYVPRVIREEVLLLKLRERGDEPQITIEVDKLRGRIVQVRGAYNRSATLLEESYIKKYAKEKGLNYK